MEMARVLELRLNLRQLIRVVELEGIGLRLGADDEDNPIIPAPEAPFWRKVRADLENMDRLLATKTSYQEG